MLSRCGIESLGRASLEEMILSNQFLIHQLGSLIVHVSSVSEDQKLQGHHGKWLKMFAYSGTLSIAMEAETGEARHSSPSFNKPVRRF